MRVTFEGITKSYKNPVLHGLTFEVRPGRVTGFLGPNGAGKSTTLSLMVGLVAADGGQVLFDGLSYESLGPRRRLVSVALDSFGFNPFVTGRRHLQYVAAAYSLPRERVEQSLTLAGLEKAADRQVRGYSLGMRQRLLIAEALISDPAVIVLDEPANGLDPEGILWLRRTLRQLADSGKTVLVSSHVLSEVEQIIDDVVMIADGRLLYAGSLVELALAGSSKVKLHTLDVTSLVGVCALHGVIPTSIDALGVTMSSRDAERIAAALQQNADFVVSARELIGESLESLYFDLLASRNTSRVDALSGDQGWD